MLALAGLARRKRARGTPQREIRPRGTPAQTTPYCIPTRPGAAGPHKVSIRDMGGGRRRAPAGSWSRAARRHPRDADPPRGADPQICRVERFRTASSLRPAVLRGSLSETATFAGLHLPSGAFSDARAFANWGFVRLPVQNRYVRGSETSGLTCARTVFDATGRHGGPRVHPLRGTVHGRHRSRAGRLWKNGSSRRPRGTRPHEPSVRLTARMRDKPGSHHAREALKRSRFAAAPAWPDHADGRAAGKPRPRSRQAPGRGRATSPLPRRHLSRRVPPPETGSPGGRHHVRATRHVLANGVLGAARPMREGPPHGPHAVASA